MDKILIRFWWLSLFVKIVIATALPLAADEAYYWFWSHHLQWSYFDHPAMVAVLLWLGHPLENFYSAVRIPGVILGHATLLVWMALLKDRLTIPQMRWWLALACLTPLIGFGSLIITPDLPVLFFWALSLWAFERSLATRAASWYAILGLALGLGFTSKYHIVLLVPILLIYLTLEKKWSRVAFAFLPITLVTGLIGSFPVLYWNATHEWASFLFQLKHGLGRTNYKPEWTLSYIVGQVLLLSPVLIPAFIRGCKRKDMRLFAWNSAFSWGFFLYATFKAVVEANWPIITFHPAAALVAAGSLSKKWIVGTCVFWSLLAAILLSHLLHPWLPGLADKADETQQYRSLAPLLTKYQPIFADTYQMASILSFETKTDVMKLNSMSRHDFFDEQPESKPTAQTFYVIRRQDEELPLWLRQMQIQTQVMETQPPDFEILRIDTP